jgi:hypothetical protein
MVESEYVGWAVNEGFVTVTAEDEDDAQMKIELNQDAVYLGTKEDLMENMEQFLKEAKDMESDKISRKRVAALLASHLESLPLTDEMLNGLVKEHKGTTPDHWRGYFEGVTDGYKIVLGEKK